MRKLVLLLTVLTAGVAAYANPFVVDFVRFNHSGQWQNGYPYWVFLQGSGFEPVMCDDYVHGGDPDFDWLANETNLGTKDLSLTRFGSENGALTLYEKGGWLLLQTRRQGLNQWTDMNSAVWNLFDPSAPCDFGCEFWLAAAQNEANKGFQGVNFDLVNILTPVHDQQGNDARGPQEFLYLDGGFGDCAFCSPGQQSGTVPEPGTLLLFATGLTVLWRGRRSS